MRLPEPRGYEVSEPAAVICRRHAQTHSDLDIHLIADNYATHKHDEVKRWLAKHPRFHMHFTPTSSSWLNLVERFFRDLTGYITEKSFASVGELSDAIIAFLAEHNRNAKDMSGLPRVKTSCARSSQHDWR
jgi:transposase